MGDATDMEHDTEEESGGDAIDTKEWKREGEDISAIEGPRSKLDGWMDHAR